MHPVTGKSTILNGDKSGLACDHYNRIDEDIVRFPIPSTAIKYVIVRIEPNLDGHVGVVVHRA